MLGEMIWIHQNGFDEPFFHVIQYVFFGLVVEIVSFKNKHTHMPLKKINPHILQLSVLSEMTSNIDND